MSPEEILKNGTLLDRKSTLFLSKVEKNNFIFFTFLD